CLFEASAGLVQVRVPAGQLCLRRLQVILAACKLGTRSLIIRNDLLQFLAGCRFACDESFLSLPFQSGLLSGRSRCGNPALRPTPFARGRLPRRAPRVQPVAARSAPLPAGRPSSPGGWLGPSNPLCCVFWLSKSFPKGIPPFAGGPVHENRHRAIARASLPLS